MSNDSQRRAGFLAEMGLGPIWVPRHVDMAAQVSQPQLQGASEHSAVAPIAQTNDVTQNPMSPAREIAVPEPTHTRGQIRPETTPLASPPAAHADAAWADMQIESAWENALPMPSDQKNLSVRAGSVDAEISAKKIQQPAPSSRQSASIGHQPFHTPSNQDDHLPFGDDEVVRQVPEAGAAGESGAIGPTAAQVAVMSWDELQAAVSGCIKCSLCKSRNKTVLGTGDQKARWLFVGEGPGRNEDQQGQPFVGPAGKLLDNMLIAMGLRRGENTYIANIVKCRPTGADGRDRPPEPEEAAACLPYLERQIALLKPAAIVALGKTAAVSLLALPPATTLSGLRGRVHERKGLPLVATFHPAYLLRKLADKAKSWVDLCLAMRSFAPAGTDSGSPASAGMDSGPPVPAMQPEQPSLLAQQGQDDDVGEDSR